MHAPRMPSFLHDVEIDWAWPELTDTERLVARLKLAELPRNANPTRVRNRCATTGRPRGVYRKFGLNRIEIRNLGNKGMIPGLTKSSW